MILFGVGNARIFLRRYPSMHHLDVLCWRRKRWDTWLSLEGNRSFWGVFRWAFRHFFFFLLIHDLKPKHKTNGSVFFFFNPSKNNMFATCSYICFLFTNMCLCCFQLVRYVWCLSWYRVYLAGLQLGRPGPCLLGPVDVLFCCFLGVGQEVGEFCFLKSEGYLLINKQILHQSLESRTLEHDLRWICGLRHFSPTSQMSLGRQSVKLAWRLQTSSLR